MIRTTVVGRVAPIAAALTLWAAIATAAQALVINQVDGRFGVFCVEDTLELPCTNGRYQRSITQRGTGRQSASDSYQSTFDTVFTGPPGVQHQNLSRAEWSATANTGRLSAGTFATLIAPAGDPVFSGQLSAATAESFFSDDWSILGPTDALRRIHVHFSLSGVINDLAGIALPFGRVYAGNGFAFARLSTTIGLDPGSNRLLGPIAIGPAGGMRERCIGIGGCGSVGSDLQGMDFFFDVAGGNLLSIFSILETAASGSALADFLGTAKLDYILAPDDVDILAASGELFRQGDRFIYRANATSVGPPPPSGMPEPGSVLLVGLALLLALRSTQNRRVRQSREGEAPLVGRPSTAD